MYHFRISTEVAEIRTGAGRVDIFLGTVIFQDASTTGKFVLCAEPVNAAELLLQYAGWTRLRLLAKASYGETKNAARGYAVCTTKWLHKAI